MIRTALALALLLIVLPTVSVAQIVNGDFEIPGCAGWTVNKPSAWTIDCPVSGGNPGGYGHIMSPFGNSGGQGCLIQGFQCGTPGVTGNCEIALDFKLDQVDASNNSGRVKIYVDGTLQYTSASMTLAWTHVSFTVPCGFHTLALCLQVDAGNNGWSACFDNVTAQCMPITPAEPQTWGRIKAIYQ